MRIPLTCLGVLFALAMSAQAAVADIAGEYSVYGSAAEGSYKGEAAVVKRGNIYHVAWSIAGQTARGTGILTGNIFSVTFVSRGAPAPGIAVYEVGPEGVLTGHFTLLGGSRLGAEALTPIKKP